MTKSSNVLTAILHVLAPDFGTRQMVNLNYGVCIRMALGYCSIEWSQSDNASFTVSGDTNSFDPSLIGQNCGCHYRKLYFKFVCFFCTKKTTTIIG